MRTTAADGARIAGTGVLERTVRGRALALALSRAGAPVSADVFMAGCLAVAAGAAGIAWAVVGSPVLALLAALGVALAARAFLASSDERYRRRFAAELPGVAQQLSSALGAGLSMRQALARVARDAPEPVAAEFRAVTAELELGGRVEEVLVDLAGRLADPSLEVIVTAILVQRQTGGNLSRALADLAARLEERERLAREIRGSTAQARMTAWLVAGLPLAGGLLVEIAAPGTLARSLGHGPGLVLLVTATLMETLGVLVIRRIAQGEA